MDLKERIKVYFNLCYLIMGISSVIHVFRYNLRRRVILAGVQKAFDSCLFQYGGEELCLMFLIFMVKLIYCYIQFLRFLFEKKW